mmetsp:Transcript_33186/g.63637  ORF Transcript_33186/g.63637 Transcript_33186/m.63637 type:complete len:232 (-) Transcript_33186:3-698(-)
MVIHFANFFLPQQGTDQHHQGRFRQMKICHQRIRHVKHKSRIDENIRIAFPGLNRATVTRRTFNQPQRCGAHRNYAPTCRLGGRNLCGGGFGHPPPFRVHLVLFHVFNFDWQKSPSPDMQCHMGERDPLGLQGRQQSLVKMQRRRRRSNRSGVLGPNGLIVGFVFFICRAFCGNVGRQRHITRRLKRRVKIVPFQIKLYQPLPTLLGQQSALETSGKDNFFTLANFPQRFD